MRCTGRVVATAVAVALGVAACDSGSSSGDDADDGPTDPPSVEAGEVVTAFAGLETTLGVVPDTPTEATGEPIVVGMINQEDTPLGSFPEVRLGAEVAVEFLNAEWNGIDGRPIELRTCTTSFSPEQSAACAQEMVQAGAVAVVGGIDLTSSGSIPVLEENEIPYVGGIPVNSEEARSPISFQFSGGTWGAMVAFADWAVDELDVERVAIIHAEYPPITDAAVTYGAEVLEAFEVDVELVPYPITATDYLPVVSRAVEGDPDAIFVGAADTGCVPVMQATTDLGVQATVFMIGACAAPRIAEEAGAAAAEGKIFNIENDASTDRTNPDVDLYDAVVAAYSDDAFDSRSAATVSFKAVMNLTNVLRGTGGEPTPEAIVDSFRGAVDEPSFDGHPYTCDGEQVPDLPALCAPQQNLVERIDGELVQINEDWIPVPEILRETGAG